MAYLEENRSSLSVPADGCFEIRRDASGESVSVFGEGIYLQCMPCGNELIENDERGLFECESCGNTLTGREANILATDYVRALSSIFVIDEEKKNKRGLLWRFATLFVSRKKRLALTS